MRSPPVTLPAPVKQPQLDARIAKRVDQRQLGAVQGPVGGEIPAVLVAVRVAQHHLLPVAASCEPRAVAWQGKRGAHDVGGTLQVVDRLEQGADIERQRVAAQKAGFFQQNADLEQIADRGTLGNDIVR